MAPSCDAGSPAARRLYEPKPTTTRLSARSVRDPKQSYVTSDGSSSTDPALYPLWSPASLGPHD
jgi:hypothetical protein